MKKFIENIIGKLGYTIQETGKYNASKYTDIREAEFWKIYDFCKPYTMTSPDRMYALYTGVKYVLDNDIQGDFVECGVWRGGSSMLIAKMMVNRNISDRTIMMYDTYEGMSEPTEEDKDFRGKNADELLEQNVSDKENSVWCLADLNDVQRNMEHTKYAFDKIKFIKGKVEDTIPSNMPLDKIALLRLDTDWYDSTKHELIHLYPRLSPMGVLIIDDYGHWEGCRKAVDEYLKENNIKILLNRIDYTGRIGIKA